MTSIPPLPVIASTRDVTPTSTRKRISPTALHGLVRVLAAAAACGAIAVAVAAGTGWLYLLRAVHGLDLGPRFEGALPLQQLAGGDAQPLARMAVAWIPTGLALGLTLRALIRLRPWARTAFAALGAAVLLLPTGAVSAALTQNEPVRAHLTDALSRGGVWMAVVLMTLGVAAAPPPRSSRAPEG